MDNFVEKYDGMLDENIEMLSVLDTGALNVDVFVLETTNIGKVDSFKIIKVYVPDL